MRVRVNNTEQFHYDSSVPVEPIKKKGYAFVIVDPGKTNMAVIVGNPFGNVYSILELSGSDDFERVYHNGSVQDTSSYCKEVREFLTKYLSELNVVEFSIEEAVTYKEQKYHRSMMTLTEIRGSLISMCMDQYGYKPKEINNMAWKSHVLPAGYSKRGDKGSHAYLSDKGYGAYSHDVTDVMCMYIYTVAQKSSKYPIWCEASEKSFDSYKYYIYPSTTIPKGHQEFPYNPQFSLEENSAYFLNRTVRNGYSKVMTDKLKLNEIYGHCWGFDDFTGNVPQISLIVKRV